VGLSLQASLATLTDDPARTQTRIDDAIAELDNVVREERAEHRYRSESAGRITDLARNFEVNTLATAHVDLDLGALELLGLESQNHAVHICREVLSNIARHASAREVHISCKVQDDEFEFEIADDGRRFDPTEVDRGHGLTNMDERARSLGGSLEIGSRSPKGMLHRLTVPIGRS